MIKGCEKRMIYIRDTGSSVFAEAYFVMRDGGCAVPYGDMVAEATRIIRERAQPTKRTAARRRIDRRSFVFGFAAGILLCTVGVLIFAFVL